MPCSGIENQRTLGPTKSRQELPARLLPRKPPLEFQQPSRVILHTPNPYLLRLLE